ncbi:MAG: HVO_0758 family zinc finger protein [Halobacteriaceae archaeon]
MKSVQKGLRDGEIEKDVYDRLVCAECGEQLKTQNDPDEIGSVRSCPDCGREWQQLG